MPSFSKETVAKWRRERVLSLDWPMSWRKDKSLDWLSVIDADIVEERRRLAKAQKQIEFSTFALSRLREKRKLYIAANTEED